MPVIDLYLSRGSLEAAQLQRLHAELVSVALTIEGGDSPASRALAWVLVHELPDSAWSVGGALTSPDNPRYLLRLTVPHGALDPAKKERMVRELGSALSRVDPAASDPTRAWVVVHEVPDGAWGAGGRVYRLADIGAFVRGVDSAERLER